MIKILYRVKILLIRMHKIETNIITEFITDIYRGTRLNRRTRHIQENYTNTGEPDIYRGIRQIQRNQTYTEEPDIYRGYRQYRRTRHI